MAILVLGGRGKTARRLASRLDAAKVPFLLASRTVAPDVAYKQVQFDWLDASTYDNPFVRASSEESSGFSPISAAYLVAPPVTDMVPPMTAFIDFARAKGARRFVLLSASVLEQGGPAMGGVHEYLASLEDVEFVVLRPTWFMENFSESHHLTTINDEGKIYSATENGKVPFVSADDIAAVAFHALTDEQPQRTEHVILGAELLSYDQVAEVLTSVLGKKITHGKLPESDLVAFLKSAGIPDDYAAMLAGMDTAIAHGAEDRLNDVVEKVTGRLPRTFEDFAVASKGQWA